MKNNVQRVADSNFDRMQARTGLTAKNQSQMNKLLPALRMGSKLDDTETTMRKALERADALNMLAQNLTEVERGLKKIHRKSYDRRMLALTEALHTLTTLSKSKPPQGTTKLIRHCLNEITSLREGVYTGEAESAADLELTMVPSAIQKIRELAVRAGHRLMEARAEDEGRDSHDDLNEEEVSEVMSRANASELILKLRETPVLFARTAVMPIPEKAPFNVRAVRAAGFEVDTLGGYPVVYDQIVMGINPKLLVQTHGVLHEYLTTARKYVRACSRREGRDLIFVDDRPHGLGPGVWFWIMDADRISSFAQAFPGSAIKLRGWGLLK